MPDPPEEILKLWVAEDPLATLPKLRLEAPILRLGSVLPPAPLASPFASELTEARPAEISPKLAEPGDA